MNCPNCNKEIRRNSGAHIKDACMLSVIGGIIRDRGTLTDAQIYDLICACNADALWDQIGPIIDAFEKGEFSQ